jgi:hypothetical protein
MNYLLISLLVFAIIVGGALAGVVVRPLLSEKHLHPDSKDVVRMATGLIGTLAALVLGLLIASAKSSFDQKTSQVKQLSATIILLLPGSLTPTISTGKRSVPVCPSIITLTGRSTSISKMRAPARARKRTGCRRRRAGSI